MKFFSIGKDGGPESNVTGFFLVEIKSLFSVVFLKFAKGTRESFHSHAFNALTLWLNGQVCEEYPDGKGRPWFPGDLKFTPRHLMHRVRAYVDSYAVSIRGPWDPTWQEFNSTTQETTTLGQGRVEIDKIYPCDLCKHSLVNNLHGFDQNDFYYDPETNNFRHSGCCTYCRECFPLPELDKVLVHQGDPGDEHGS